MVCQEVLKALINVLDNSEEEKNVCLGVKKPVAQVPSPTTSMSVLQVGQPAAFNAPSPTTSAGYIFTNIQDANIYKEFMIANDEI